MTSVREAWKDLMRVYRGNRVDIEHGAAVFAAKEQFRRVSGLSPSVVDPDRERPTDLWHMAMARACRVRHTARSIQQDLSWCPPDVLQDSARRSAQEVRLMLTLAQDCRRRFHVRIP